MDEELQEDWLDARLREEAPYVDDAGFTAQLVQKLPARRAAGPSFRGAILLAITIFACVVTYFASGGGYFLISAVDTLATWPLWMVCTIAILCGIIATVVAAGAAWSQAREEML
ncbi:MAG TPA: hypothetical protein VGI85_01075 [Chthoniobacterales bacterium]|jgi:hypothetical protein